ncbi:VCBS repeat-containing protein [Fulvivirga lutimaris]|uniref:VCBS repeat-containing protein n=1 Tax=Fulvivirga lutimaris TaxID=1819566 RepID=UPI0016295765|nr:VCBS repeat-containing protein [Fulvivirga lutimaris]
MNCTRYAICLLSIVTLGCNTSEKPERELFTYVNPDESGVQFVNAVEMTDSINILNYIYSYNGSGVGVGDIDNDGLEDLFFAANLESSKLYLNQGDLKFKDITTSAGVTTNRWCTGVSMVDINTDGFLDVYVSVAGAPNPAARANLLFINNGDQTFREEASAYGIADTSYTTHAAFFDYDRDGDLDLYLLNHANDRTVLNTPIPKMVDGQAQSTDKLYRNNGPGKAFTDVSAEAGILIEGYGLGVAVSDINKDGWPDLYISNDFIYNDLLYINNQDGTFSNVIKGVIQEQTYNGMGNEVSDFNNDGLPDVVVTDMLPPDPVGEKTMASFMTYDKYVNILDKGYEPQFMRNTLQMNQGDMNFIEIGRYAGIYRTDWSWAPLMADFNNDGWKDLYITNGYLKDITDKDFVDYNNNLTMFKSKEVANEKTLQRMDELNGRKLSNFMFQNKTDLTFSDQTKAWGLENDSFSNGAAYADLDNDGDLDMVVNNINDPAFVIRNNMKNDNHISIQLKGPTDNPQGLGTQLTATTKNNKQFIEQTIYRGFMSSMTAKVHFGFGEDSVIQQLEVLWPDGSYQTINDIPAKGTLTIDYNDRESREVYEAEAPPYFEDITAKYNIAYKHNGRDPVNFKVQPLLPYRVSATGPVLASGDLDGNGMSDLVIGGGSTAPTKILFQDKTAQYEEVSLAGTTGSEITAIEILDINNDGLNDIYLACGGSSSAPGGSNYSDKVYLGTGTKAMKLAENVVPVHSSTSTVAAADFDQDGDLDLFVGGYAVPQNFPAVERSYVLRNDNGRFMDVTTEVSEKLLHPGLVKGAAWGDVNNDGMPDLMLVGEWMPIQLFINDSGHFSYQAQENTSGWWQSITPGDFDGDGDIDFLCGNVGLNNSYVPTSSQPVVLYAPDLNNDGTLDPLMTYFVNGHEAIHASRGVLFKQQPFLNRKFQSHLSYAQASIEQIIPSIDGVTTLEAETFSSVILYNDGKGSFRPEPLPDAAQYFPIRTSVATDLNGDGRVDFLLGGGISDVGYDGKSLGPQQLLAIYNYNAKESETKNIAIGAGGDVVSIVSIDEELTKGHFALGIRDHKIKIIQLNQ